MKYLVTMQVSVPLGVPNPEGHIATSIPAALDDYAAKFGIGLKPEIHAIKEMGLERDEV
jgi:hypothetical protein